MFRYRLRTLLILLLLLPPLIAIYVAAFFRGTRRRTSGRSSKTGAGIAKSGADLICK